MEVFPLEDAPPNEMGGTPISQVDPLKSWDASFAQLEKMLQAACETEGVDQSSPYSNQLSPTMKPQMEPNSPKPDCKRKRVDSESSDQDETKLKVFRTNETIPNELTLTPTNPPEDFNPKTEEVSPDSSNVNADKSDSYSGKDINESFGPLDEANNVNKSSNRNLFQYENSAEDKIEDIVPADQNMCKSVDTNKSSLATSMADYDQEPQSYDATADTTLEENSSENATETHCSIATDQSSSLFTHSAEDAANDAKSSNSDSVFPSSDKEDLTTTTTEQSTQEENCDKNSDMSNTPNSGNTSEGKERKDKEKEDQTEKNSKKDDKKKKKFERCNIRDIKLEDELDAVTLAAQKEEQERIKRLQEAQMRALQERLQIIEVEKEALSQLFSQPNADDANMFDSSENENTECSDSIDDKSKIPLIKTEADCMLLESSDEDKKTKMQDILPTPVESDENIIDISSSSSEDELGRSDSEDDSDKKDDDVLVLSDEGEAETPEGPEDPNNSGAHTNDCFNLLDLEGRVLVNVGHPPEDTDIYLAPQIAKMIKPHQIGGIRFLYDNVVENLERYKSSTGFGCILAHSMGLGKTVQVVSFVDVFLRHTPATLVLCIVPINTIQNWKAEFDMWVPATSTTDNEQVESGEVRPRDYNVYTLNENFKTMAARASLIAEWRANSGVLLMGYEMYRMLALRKMPKIPMKKGRRMKKQEVPVEPETTDQIKKFMDQMYEHIVIPGPDLVICDEGHRIKNSLASTSMALKSIKTRRRIVLTGYPLQNNLLEYWCMVDFVRPNYLGSRAEFCNMFERPISNGQCIDSTPRDRQLMRFRSHVLHSLLVGFVQRRGHSVLRAVLPRKEEHVLLIRMTSIQRQLYKCFVKDLLYVQQATNPLKLFAVCCKIWNHPDILYKLLQEKKAREEDIDLDIDLTSTSRGATPGSTALLKRKATKDQLKMKAIHPSLNNTPLKIENSELVGPKPEPMMLQGNPCGQQAENQISESGISQPNSKTTPEHMFTGSNKIFKEEFTSPSSVTNQQHQSNIGYSHVSMLGDSTSGQQFSQPQYSQQSTSFCQPNFSQQANVQQCQSSSKVSQYNQHQHYPSQSQSQQQQQYLNNSVSQPQYVNPNSVSPGSSAQLFPQSTHSPSQHNQQFNVQPNEQNYSSQVPVSESFHQQMSQFSTAVNSSQYPPAPNVTQQQKYSQAYNQQSPKSQMPFSQENSQQYGLQAPQNMVSQTPFSQTNQQYTAPSNLPTYASQPHQFTPPTTLPSQYGQSAPKYNEHSSAQSVYSEKNTNQLPAYNELCNNETQPSHDPSASQQQTLYPEHKAMPQQFNQPAPSTQFNQRPQSSLQNRSQQPFTPSAPVDSKPSLSQGTKLIQQASPQHFSQQASPQYSQQASPLQAFSQCSPSQQPQYSQHSPPLQPSPTQQFSLPSPTQQAYPPFSQSSHQQYGQSQTSHQYSQEASPQQSFPQTQYSHHQSTQQYPKHSSPQQQSQQFSHHSSIQQQQFSHQSSKQNLGQQFVPPNAQYPSHPSTQQHFSHQSRQTFGVAHQQYPQQSFKSHVSSQYPQGSHSQYPAVSPQSANSVQQFNSASQGSSHSFSQPLPSHQQHNSDQFSLQMSQQKSQSTYSANPLQNVPSPQYSTQVGKPQPTASPSSFVQPQSPSQQYTQQGQTGCHQGMQPKPHLVQHSFNQQSTQNSQLAFQPQYQSQMHSPMQPSSQVLPIGNQGSNSQLPSKGNVKSTMQQLPDTSIESLQNSSYVQQAFQNSSSDSALCAQKQNMVPGQNITSSYQSMSSTMIKQENFVDTVKEESDVYSRANKSAVRPLKPVSTTTTTTSMLPYQGQMQTPDMITADNEHVTVVNPDPIITPSREKLDSSINYEWAIPIMKEYVLGVLENSHKMMVLFSIIERTVQKGEKLLVFSQSLSTLDLLEQFLGNVTIPVPTSANDNCNQEFWCRNKNYFRLDGSTSAQEREKLINEFNKNDTVCLFLLSTRAGCLGINLVGANRIVVMDASWNPCHDAQAVCRIYRYGQKKQCHIYRLVTDNSLEKRIYDRQVNKQGMSDRVVDELNPESNFTWKDVTTLIQDDEDDGPSQELSKFSSSYTDDVLKYLVTDMGSSLSKEPFEHESLLLDRKDLKLTKQEKRLAKQSYEMAKRANMINIRTTYTYMPGGGGQFIINNKQCQWVGGSTVRVLPGQAGRGTGSRPGTTATPITASPSLMNSLFKQGVMVQKLTIPSTISIPVLTPGAPPVVVPAGQDVLVLRTPKGVYLRLPDGRIIAVQLPPSLLAKTQFRPNVVTHFRPNVKGNNQTGGGRGQSIGIVKQTLQCGGTVRYLGPKGDIRSPAQNSRNSAPEVIDLSDDDEPTTKKSTAEDPDESDSNEKDQKPNFCGKTNIFQNKQITIRRVSSTQPSTISLPNTKEKCDLPLKLQQNQQITIMPINPSGQQNRQKLAPQLAQPVRVQQMLLQPQQVAKGKPLPKSTTKIQLSSLPLSKNFQRSQITVTPTLSSPLQKTKSPVVIQTLQKSPETSNSPKISERSPAALSSKESFATITETTRRDNSDVILPLESHGAKVERSCNSSIPPLASNQNNITTKPVTSVMPIVPLSTSNTVSEVLKPASSSIAEMNQQISSLLNQNLHSGSKSPSCTPPSHSNSISQVLPISISHLPSSVSVTPITQNFLDPQASTSASLGSQAPSCTFLPISSQSTNALFQDDLSVCSQETATIEPLSKQPPSGSQLPSDSLFRLSNQTLHQSSSHIIEKSSQSQKSSSDISKLPNSMSIPKLPDSISLTAVDSLIHAPSIQMPKPLQPPYSMEHSQNGQLQSDSPYIQPPLPHLTHPSGHQPVASGQLGQSSFQSSTKKKKSNRQSTKKSTPVHSQMGMQNNQPPISVSESLPQFPHSLSEHLHDPHRFQPFSHALQNSDFQPFQSYSAHKPLLHIQHPQPLHPLQHSQEHSLSSHLPHLSHLYPMPSHMPGTSSTLPEIQPQAPRAWPVPQPSFHPFGQSSQYYGNPHDSSQFSFQPSSFTLTQPTASRVSQPESDTNVSGMEHGTNPLSSEL